MGEKGSVEQHQNWCIEVYGLPLQGADWIEQIVFFVSIRDGEQKSSKIHVPMVLQEFDVFLLKGILWDLPCPADWDYTSNGKIKCGLLWEDVFLNKNEWLSFLYVYQKLESHGLVKTYLPNVCHFLGQNIKSRTLNRAIWPVSFKFYIFCNAYRTFCRSKISVPQAFPWYSQGMTIEDYLRVVYICSVSHIIHTWLTAPIVVYGINTDWFP